jgi:hypothetical protein
MADPEFTTGELGSLQATANMAEAIVRIVIFRICRLGRGFRLLAGVPMAARQSPIPEILGFATQPRGRSALFVGGAQFRATA